ncbi:MAG: hypothetical protein K0U84_01750 [Actinomycetia bacterium]|nr:hypothetical protein [Actinomycetes bacterium]
MNKVGPSAVAHVLNNHPRPTSERSDVAFAAMPVVGAVPTLNATHVSSSNSATATAANAHNAAVLAPTSSPQRI